MFPRTLFKLFRKSFKKTPRKLAYTFQEQTHDSDHLDALMANLLPGTKQLFWNDISLSLKTPTVRRYTEEIKTFANTLCFYSLQACRFMRKHKKFPHSSKIRLCTSSLNCEPEFMKDVLDSMAQKLSDDSN